MLEIILTLIMLKLLSLIKLDVVFMFVRKGVSLKLYKYCCASS